MIEPRARERGAAAIEMASLIPILILAGLVALQVGIAGWAMVATGQAARDGARAQSLGDDPAAAVEAALPGALVPQPGTGGSHTAKGYRQTVVVKVPSLLPFEVGSVTRTAEMPDLP
ncbi:TadE/TadG family type IV pilus assembly protein [Janibacter sp. G56]|uniref:TadE/TadG family type IV pilus assembly protein n=1 Tax=Janibacter sp. G56 TaxID=3418717 RepID=UPI003D05708D